jgi:hypothetical protein
MHSQLQGIQGSMPKADVQQFEGDVEGINACHSLLWPQHACTHTQVDLSHPQAQKNTVSVCAGMLVQTVPVLLLLKSQVGETGA